MLFYHISTASLARLNPGLRIFMPAVLNIISNGHKNFKNNQNNVKPSRGVILCIIVARKNIKLGKLQTPQKALHKTSYHVRCFMAFSQMTNVMARIVTQFMIMCPYCIHMCIIGFLTMLQKEVFLFSARKSHFPFFRCQKQGFL
jgi:hypothetical protein